MRRKYLRNPQLLFFYVLVYHGRPLFWALIAASLILDFHGMQAASWFTIASALGVSFFNLGLSLGRANVPEA